MNTNSPLTQADVQSLFVRCNGNRKLALRMVKLFREETSRFLYELLTASAPKDWSQVARAAHTIRGSASMVSANSVAQLAEELELLTNSFGTKVDAQKKVMELVSTLLAWQELDPEMVASQFGLDDST